jgi:hypothetical protein
VTKVIIAGYPKSGCTWATRLVAELIGCPVGGFWPGNEKDIASEGQNRVSDYSCHKAHHQINELGINLGDPDHRVIYVLRDPRDIAISGAHYFEFIKYPRIAALFRKVRRGEKLYRHTLYPILVRQNYRLEMMTEALLHGSRAVHNWVRISWKQHWGPYHRAGTLIVRYEDLLTTPVEQATRILRYLDLARSEEAIRTAVQNQSFQKKKETFLRQGETGRAKFMRVGKAEQWREQLPAHLQRRFAEELAAELTQWNYDT